MVKRNDREEKAWLKPVAASISGATLPRIKRHPHSELN